MHLFFMHIQLNNHFSEYDTKFSEYGTSVIVLIFIFAANIINNNYQKYIGYEEKDFYSIDGARGDIGERTGPEWAECEKVEGCGPDECPCFGERNADLL